jgi:hypothetical protein
MPKIQWEQLPREKWAHLRDRAKERKISDGDWYKDFGTFKLCGAGRYPSTFLMAGQSARGTRL